MGVQVTDLLGHRMKNNPFIAPETSLCPNPFSQPGLTSRALSSANRVSDGDIAR
jgi:hypothetical protein